MNLDDYSFDANEILYHVGLNIDHLSEGIIIYGNIYFFLSIFLFRQ